jgi:hypothetical protein
MAYKLVILLHLSCHRLSLPRWVRSPGAEVNVAGAWAEELERLGLARGVPRDHLDAGSRAVVVIACSANESTYASMCPAIETMATCPVAPGALCLHGGPAVGCALDGLPSGMSCSGHAQCSMPVLPCPNEVQTWSGTGRVDGYVCSCLDDRWSCDDCAMGGAVCAEAPDAGPLDAAPNNADGSADSGTAGPGVVTCIPRPETLLRSRALQRTGGIRTRPSSAIQPAKSSPENESS